MKISAWLRTIGTSVYLQHSRRRTRNPLRTMERLEQRVVPATTQFTSGVMTITAQNNEAVTVTVSNNNVLINGSDSKVLASAVSEMLVNGDAGANNINLSAITEADFTSLNQITVVAGVGADTIIGSQIDDFILWKNGDGSDSIEGNSGQDRIQVNGATSGEEVFNISGSGGRLSFQRTSLTAFTLNAASIEDLVVNARGGNDSVTVGNTATTGLDNVTVLGGDGNDIVDMRGINLDALRLLTLDGQEGTDTIVAGAGNDANNNQADAFVLELVETLTGREAELSVNGSTLFASPDESSQIRVIGSGDSDSLTLNTIGAGEELGIPLPSNGLIFDGKSGIDTISINGNLETTAVNFITATSGSIEIELQAISFSNTEAINDNSTATSRTLFYPATADVVTVSDTGTATDRAVRIATANGVTTTIVQASQDGTLTVNLGDGADSLAINSLDDAFAGSLFVDGDTGNDIITVGSLANVTSALELNIDVGDGDDIVNAGSSTKTVIVYGGAGNDSLTGGAGNDSLFGELGNDTFTGGAGNDQIRGAQGTDSLVESGDFDFTLQEERLVGNGTDNIRVDRATITAGESDNILDASAFNGPVLLIGGAGSDEITGSLFNDTILGGIGDDTVFGLAGGDILRGDAGNDSLIGGVGNDNLLGGVGNDDFLWQNGDNSDVVSGISGEDVLTVTGSTTAGDVFTLGPNVGQARFQRTNLVPFSLDLIGVEALVVEGDGGDDSFTVNSLSGVASLSDITFGGGSGNDTLSASATSTAIFAFGDAGDDSLTGGTANDHLEGGDGNDLLTGGDGNDLLSGGAGTDSVVGGNGNDQLSGGLDNDTLNGNAGVDTLVEEADVNFTLTATQLRGGLGIDSQSELEVARLTGGASGNIINASAFTGATTLFGLAGNDTITGGSASDSIRGGDGDDQIDAGLGNDLVNGSNGNDTINGGDGNDGLSGFTGNDLIVGNAGNDTLIGGVGDDVLLGGSGSDICLGKEGNDTINGQGSVDDTLAGGSGSGADVGDSILEAVVGEIDELFQFQIVPSWINQA